MSAGSTDGDGDGDGAADVKIQRHTDTTRDTQGLVVSTLLSPRHTVPRHITHATATQHNTAAADMHALPQRNPRQGVDEASRRARRKHSLRHGDVSLKHAGEEAALAIGGCAKVNGACGVGGAVQVLPTTGPTPHAQHTRTHTHTNITNSRVVCSRQHSGV